MILPDPRLRQVTGLQVADELRNRVISLSSVRSTGLSFILRYGISFSVSPRPALGATVRLDGGYN